MMHVLFLRHGVDATRAVLNLYELVQSNEYFSMWMKTKLSESSLKVKTQQQKGYRCGTNCKELLASAIKWEQTTHGGALKA